MEATLPTQLSAAITEGQRVLLLDCRPFIPFNQGHILSACNVHYPPILKRRSGGFVALENIIPNEAKRLQLVSGHYTCAVLYDQDTNRLLDGRPDAGDSDLCLVMKSLRKQVAGVNIFYLIGGYAAFQNIFSHLCVCEKIYLDKYINKPVVAEKFGGSPVEILPHVFLGDHSYSNKRELLIKLGITGVINVSRSCQNHFPREFHYLTIPVDDNHCADLSAWFRQAIGFIDAEKRLGGRVLVHCQAGISRSATVCLAYLMKANRLALDVAFEYVRERRSIISPNLNFMRQLQDFEKELSATTQLKNSFLKSPCRSETTLGRASIASFGFPDFHQSLMLSHSSPLASPT